VHPFNTTKVLKSIDIDRLEQLKNDIDRLHLRFPVTAIAQRMGINKGNVSSYLSGRVPLSDNFLKNFYTVFAADLERMARQEIPGQEPSVKEPEPNFAASGNGPSKSPDWEKEKERLKNIEYQLSTIAKVLKTMLNRQMLTEGAFRHNKPAVKRKKKPGG
jgi:transcriptional regulator with XRE-family HTH domain